MNDDKSYILVYSILSLFSVTSYFMYKNNIGDENWFDPNVFFLLGYLIVFYQMPIKILLGYFVTESNFGVNFLNYNYINYGLFISTIALSCYMIGVFSTKIKANNRKMNSSNNKFDNLIFIRKSTFSISGVLFIVYIISNKGHTYGEGITFSSELIYSFLNLSSIVLFTVSGYIASYSSKKSFLMYIKKYDKFSLCLLLIMCVFFSSIGTRASVLTWVLSFLTPYFLFVHKLSFKKLVVSIVFAMVFVAWAATLRSSEDISFTEKIYNSMNVFENLSLLSENYSNIIYFALTYQLENSYLAYNELIRLTDVNGCVFGIGWLTELLSAIVPLGGNFVVDLFNINPYHLSSAVYLSSFVSKDFSGVGYGSTILGDIYYNFGLLGIVFFMFTFGRFVSCIKTLVLSGKGSAFHLSCVCVFSYLLICAFLVNRNIFSLGWTMYVRIFILIYFLNYIFNRMRS